MPYTAGTIRWLGSKRPERGRDLEVDDRNRAAAALIGVDRGVVLTGPVGAGKTRMMLEYELAVRAADVPPTLHPRQIWLDDPSFWTTAEEFVEDVRRGWVFAKKYSDFDDRYSAEGVARRCRRLFLDDLGVEQRTDHATETVRALLTHRCDGGAPTWITTNLAPAELIERYGERTFSRLFAASEFVELEGNDRRLALPLA